MSDNNWYSSESWYAPLKRAEAPDPAKREGKQENKKKKKVWPRVFGGIMLLLVLIVGSSYALRESAQKLPVLFPKASDKPADNGRDDGFFQGFLRECQGNSRYKCGRLSYENKKRSARNKRCERKCHWA
jgi:hypothetical protein